MNALILRADARHLPLPDESVDLIVTSPPYFGLRSYTDACDQCGGAGRAHRPDSHGLKVCPNGCEATARKRCHFCGSSMVWPKRPEVLITNCEACNGTGHKHYDGQIGSEATPQQWLAALIDGTREWVRVLKPSGSLFINLGDKYATRYSSQRGRGRAGLNGDDATRGRSGQNHTGIGEKSLLGLPWRYAIAATDQLGLILRAEIIWAKLNGLPESVTDRVRRAHEQVFHFTRQPRYYTAIDEIREQYSDKTVRTYPTPYGAPGTSRHGKDSCTLRLADNPLGKLPGSVWYEHETAPNSTGPVWAIPNSPLQVPASLGVDHFAAFPPALIRPIILGWTPPGICTACGQGRRPVMDAGPVKSPKHSDGSIMGSRRSPGDFRGWDGLPRFNMARAITGYVCACTPYTDRPERRGTSWHPHDADSTRGARPTEPQRPSGPRESPREYHLDGWQPPPTRPAVVLDPFGGTGTTALVATVHGRHGISVDLSTDYCRIAAWRVNDPGERARAMDVPKPPPIPDGMEPLFDIS